MGRQLAIDIARTEADLELKIGWHLSANFYPPIAEAFVPVVSEAVRLATHQQFEDSLRLPNGVEMKVVDIVDELELEPFLLDWKTVEGQDSQAIIETLQTLSSFEHDWHHGGECEE